MSNRLGPNEFNRISLEQYLDERPKRLYAAEIDPEGTYIARLKPYHIRRDIFITDRYATVPKIEAVEFEDYYKLEIVLLGLKNIDLREKFLTDDGVLFDFKPAPHNIANMEINEERGYFMDLDIVFGDINEALMEAVSPALSTAATIGGTALMSK